ncbi:hypothetical protein GCM10010303_11200 [Streptomyces purpurascens]|nr:hypothetical protein GCM10010303_11200 [Streptomyces purpurascens]
MVLDDVADEFPQGHLRGRCRAVEPGDVRAQDAGRDRSGQGLARLVLVGVVPDHLVPDHLPARYPRIAAQRDHRRVVVLDQVSKGDRLPVGGIPRLGQLQLAAPLRGLGPLGPHLLLFVGQRSLVVLAGALVGEVLAIELWSAQAVTCGHKAAC